MAFCSPSCLEAQEPSGGLEGEDKVQMLKVAESQTRGQGYQAAIKTRRMKPWWSRHCAWFLFSAAIGKCWGR